MGVAKQLGCNPREFAQKVLDVLDLDGMAAKTEIAGPGFINIFLSQSGCRRKQMQRWQTAVWVSRKLKNKTSLLTTQHQT